MFTKVLKVLLCSAFLMPTSFVFAENHEITEDATAQTSVIANIGSGYSVLFPKQVDISSKVAKETNVPVIVKGDIAGDETLNVVPDTTVTMKNQEANSTKEDVIVTVTFAKTAYTWDEIDGDGYSSDMVLAHDGFTSGSWLGTLNVTISNVKN